MPGPKAFLALGLPLIFALGACRTTKFGGDEGLKRSGNPPAPSNALPSPVPGASPVPSPGPSATPDPQDTITKLEVMPATRVIAIGETGAYTALATYTASGMRDVTASAVWTSANPGIVASKGGGVFQGVAAGTGQVVATHDGQTAEASASVPAGIPALKVGVNFEDRPFTGDRDFNDAVLCFTGKVSVAPNAVTSLADQTIVGVVTWISSCHHDMEISLSGPGAYKWSSGMFRTSTQPKFNIPFKAGSVLNIQYKPLGGCKDNSGVTVGMYNKDWAQLLPNQCNTTGR